MKSIDADMLITVILQRTPFGEKGERQGESTTAELAR
jgi:hypothetical protein